MAPLQTVNRFLAAIAGNDADAACALVTEDFVMECTVLGHQRGRDTLYGTLVNHVDHLDSVVFEVHREADVDGVVMHERTETLVQGDCTIVIDAAGHFEFAPDGRISRWKDHFDPREVDVFPRAIAPRFAWWEAMPGLVDALALVAPSERGNVGLDRRRAAFEALIESIRPELDEDRRKAVAAIMRELTSADTWQVLTHHHWVTTGVAAAATAWTMRLQLDALRDGDLPAPWFSETVPEDADLVTAERSAGTT
jgi:limonene-1,2-epoxide hydrolase